MWLLSAFCPASAVLQKRGELERAAADAVLKALASPAAAGGDVLCFMPGVAEIRRLQQLLQQESAIVRAGIAVQQLHGSLSPQQQDEVIRSATGWQQHCRRKRHRHRRTQHYSLLSIAS